MLKSLMLVQKKITCRRLREGSGGFSRKTFPYFHVKLFADYPSVWVPFPIPLRGFDLLQRLWSTSASDVYYGRAWTSLDNSGSFRVDPGPKDMNRCLHDGIMLKWNALGCLVA